MLLTLYVPRPDAAPWIAPRSAIVGVRLPVTCVTCGLEIAVTDGTVYHRLTTETHCPMSTAEAVAAPERVLVYFEGNTGNIPCLATFGLRLRRAAERLTSLYPSKARAVLPPDLLLQVGRYNPVSGRIVELWHRDELSSWLAGEPLPDLPPRR